ncbi:hypothetical protein H5410_026140 [Solanum commersonii]|uniref:Uncharacterized protein n=1 Tax=Solanum commersonii TaxID=4109 RepID=A0A9J5YXW8_SOLCO|nr:hypothetical protein H5410_026140 [Solanum commersonii]
MQQPRNNPSTSKPAQSSCESRLAAQKIDPTPPRSFLLHASEAETQKQTRTIPTINSNVHNAGHQTETNRYRTETGRFDRVVDQYRNEPDRNNWDGGSVSSRPTIYRDGSERNGMG